MKFIAVFITLACINPVQAQQQFNLQAQAYDLGVMPMVEFQTSHNEQWDFIYRAGVLVAEENNWSPADEVKSRGVGVGFGLLRKAIGWGQLQLQLSTDFWYREVTQQNEQIICPIAPPCFNSSYNTDSQMLTILPSVGLHYVLPIHDRFQLVPNAAFGYQHNVFPKGASIPNSTILTAGIKIGYRI
jgi:hypothetical protein